jgi:hypothetical protein
MGFIPTAIANSIKQSSSSEAVGHSARHEIPRPLLNPMVHYRVRKSPSMVISCASRIQPTSSQPIYVKFVLILSSHLHLSLWNFRFSSCFPIKIMYAFLTCPTRANVLSISLPTSLTLSKLTIWNRDISDSISLGNGLDHRIIKVRFPAGPRDFCFRHQTGTTNPIQLLPGDLFPGLERPGREDDQSAASSAQIRNAWSYSSTLPYVLTV